ncbi:cbb3-type cytochrome oxidase subunit 1 [Lachnospiraceae bacterium PF1-21]
MKNKMFVSVLGMIIGVILCLISSSIYFGVGGIIHEKSLLPYYPAFYPAVFPSIVGIICFALLLLVEGVIQKSFHHVKLNYHFYLMFAISILVSSLGIAIYEGTKDEFGEISFFLICAIWVTVGILRSFVSLYKDIRQTSCNRWYKSIWFYFAIIFLIINIVWMILCS